MNKRTLFTMLMSMLIVLLLLLQMMVVGDSTISAGKPPTKTPRPTNTPPGGDNRSAGCGQTPPSNPGETGAFSLTWDGIERTYTVHLPPDYDENTPLSLVVSIHGYSGNADEQENVTSLMSEHADANGYIVAYPDGHRLDDGSGGFIQTWNDWACNGSPGPLGPICAHNAYDYPNDPTCNPKDCNCCACDDDIGFIGALLDAVEDSYCVDTRRVYATGFSTGGGFTQKLGCVMSDRFAAVAPVHGQLYIGYNCAPGTTSSIMAVWGTQDNIVPADGSLSTDGYWYTTIDDEIAEWASADSQNCDASATSYTTVSDGTKRWTCTQRANCATGAEVVECSWLGTHWYPKTRQGDSFGNDAIWEFFQKNPKP